MNDRHFDFDTPVNRKNTDSTKWDLYKGHDIIPLWVADMDFRSPPQVIEALHERVNHGVFGYTSTPPELVEAVIASLAAEFGWDVDPGWLVWLPGLVTGLNVASRAIGSAGDEVLSFAPVYPPFLSAPRLNDRTLVKVPLTYSAGRWEPDFEALAEAVTPRTRLILLCNPHNPVGRAWTRAELTRLAEVAEKHDIVICSDEIHASLVLDEDKRHIPIATLSPETARRTITLQAPSKTFNIPGLACSFAVISDPGLRRAFHHAMGRLVPHVNTLGYTAAIAAYRYGEPWRRDLISYLRANRDLVEAEVATMPGVTISHVEATYLAWIDCRPGGIEAPGHFFEQAGVGLSDGTEFDLPGFVRLNFGCPRSVLTEALGRMRRALEKAAQGATFPSD